MDDITKIKRAREGGDMLLFHSIPHHNHCDAGKYGYSAVSLLLVLHPKPSLELVKALLWHTASDGSSEKLFELPKSCEKWFNAVNTIAEWLFLNDETQMGNKNVGDSIKHIDDYLKTIWDDVPLPCRDFLSRYRLGRIKVEVEWGQQ